LVRSAVKNKWVVRNRKKLEKHCVRRKIYFVHF